MDIAEITRKAVRNSGKTRYRIAQESKVTEPQLCRLMQGRTLTAETLEILLEYFGYKIVKKGRAKK